MLDPDLDKYRRIDPAAIVNTAIDTIAGGISDDIRADCRMLESRSGSSRRSFAVPLSGGNKGEIG